GRSTSMPGNQGAPASARAADATRDRPPLNRREKSLRRRRPAAARSPLYAPGARNRGTARTPVGRTRHSPVARASLPNDPDGNQDGVTEDQEQRRGDRRAPGEQGVADRHRAEPCGEEDGVDPREAESPARIDRLLRSCAIAHNHSRIYGTA